MIFHNPSFDPHALFAVPGRAALAFHTRFPSYHTTPLRFLTSFAKHIGVERVLVKDESHRLGLPAFKILGASWAAYSILGKQFPEVMRDWKTIDELKSRLSNMDQITFYSATDGNHGRAVARVAQLFGLNASIYVPKGTAPARISAIESEGARVTVVDGTYDDTVSRAASEATSNSGILIQDSGWEGYEEVPHYVIEGYSTMLWEIDAQLDATGELPPTHVIVQIGVGSLADAVVRHYRAKGLSTILSGVEPNTATCALESVRRGRIVSVPGPHTSIMAGMNCDTPSLVSFPVLLKGIRCFVAISDERAKEAVRLLARKGIVSGETGAAGMGALLELFSEENYAVREVLHFNSQSRILIISTEGATDPVSYSRIVNSGT